MFHTFQHISGETLQDILEGRNPGLSAGAEGAQTPMAAAHMIRILSDYVATYVSQHNGSLLDLQRFIEQSCASLALESASIQCLSVHNTETFMSLMYRRVTDGGQVPFHTCVERLYELVIVPLLVEEGSHMPNLMGQCITALARVLTDPMQEVQASAEDIYKMIRRTSMSRQHPICLQMLGKFIALRPFAATNRVMRYQLSVAYYLSMLRMLEVIFTVSMPEARDALYRAFVDFDGEWKTIFYIFTYLSQDDEVVDERDLPRKIQRSVTSMFSTPFCQEAAGFAMAFHPRFLNCTLALPSQWPSQNSKTFAFLQSHLPDICSQFTPYVQEGDQLQRTFLNIWSRMHP